MIIGEQIYNRNLMQLYDLYFIISTIIASLTVSFERIFYGFICLIIGLIRFDKSLMQEWIDNFIKLDMLVNSFESTLFIHNYFTNPIKEHFNNNLIGKHSFKQRGLKILWISFNLIKLRNTRFLRKNIKLSSKFLQNNSANQKAFS